MVFVFFPIRILYSYCCHKSFFSKRIWKKSQNRLPLFSLCYMLWLQAFQFTVLNVTTICCSGANRMKESEEKSAYIKDKSFCIFRVAVFVPFKFCLFVCLFACAHVSVLSECVCILCAYACSTVFSKHCQLLDSRRAHTPIVTVNHKWKFACQPHFIESKITLTEEGERETENLKKVGTQNHTHAYRMQALAAI